MAEQLRIDPIDAGARVDAGDAIILDVVSPLAWEQLDRAIQGAVRIAPDQLGDRWAELPRERAVIAYCTWPSEHTSAGAAQFLRGQGYRAYALRGGLDAWVRAGLPTEPKANVESREIADVCPDCGGAVGAHGGRRQDG